MTIRNSPHPEEAAQRPSRRTHPADVALAPCAPASAERDAAISDFLGSTGWGGVVPTGLAGDASFRRYYRLDDGARRVVLMDAPPPMEDVRPYVAVSAMLRGLGLSAPEIHAEDPALGFLLVEDF